MTRDGDDLSFVSRASSVIATAAIRSRGDESVSGVMVRFT